MPPASSQVRVEKIDSDARMRAPYRGIATGRDTLRSIVSIYETRARHPRAVKIEVATPEGKVARFIERTIEDRLGLRDEAMRGELRVAW